MVMAMYEAGDLYGLIVQKPQSILGVSHINILTFNYEVVRSKGWNFNFIIPHKIRSKFFTLEL
jgi:hypothetical protein